MARLKIRVSPRSSRAEVVFENGTLKAYLHAPPADGRANEELIDMLARTLTLRKSDIKLIRGQKSRDKEIEVANLQQEELDTLLSRFPQS